MLALVRRDSLAPGRIAEPNSVPPGSPQPPSQMEAVTPNRSFSHVQDRDVLVVYGCTVPLSPVYPGGDPPSRILVFGSRRSSVSPTPSTKHDQVVSTA